MNENISMLQTALRFLDEHNEIPSATCQGDLPKIRIFQIMRREGNLLYFATSAEKAVWRELLQNQHVELLAYADNISVRCRGMVTFDAEDSVKQWLHHHNPVLSRLDDSSRGMAFFCLPIAEWDYYDLTPTPPVFKHFNLKTGEVSNGFVGSRFKSK